MDETIPRFRPTLQQEAARSGLKVWNGRPVNELTDQECRDYFAHMGRECGIYYIRAGE